MVCRFFESKDNAFSITKPKHLATVFDTYIIIAEFISK